jgi:thymidylate kinase
MASNNRATLRRFIVFEGGDGAGTTTQLHRLDAALQRASVPHWVTSEPTDAPEGRLIRRILSGELRRDPATLARLYAADRNEHLSGSGGIRDRLARGEAVICDRYVFSSLAYQGVTCGPDLPAKLNEDFPLPELLVFFDLSATQSVGRLSARPSLDIFEELPFQEKVRAAYLKALDDYASSGMRIIRIDASRGVEEVGRDILCAVEATLGLRLSVDEE